MKFPLGSLQATPAALEVLERSGEDPYSLIMRHANCDWGTCCSADCKANEEAVRMGLRVLSMFETKLGEKVWVVTEGDRSSTTVIIPSDY